MPLAAISTLQSAGPILFAPDVSPEGSTVLFAADVTAATVHAFELPTEGASRRFASTSSVRNWRRFSE
jgi:hypothetical protein